MSSLFRCDCGKHKICPAKNSISFSNDGQVKVKSSEWFKCGKFKEQMKNIDILILDNKE